MVAPRPTLRWNKGDGGRFEFTGYQRGAGVHDRACNLFLLSNPAPIMPEPQISQMSADGCRQALTGPVICVHLSHLWFKPPGTGG